MNTVPKNLPEAPNRRAALAWVALQNAPTPTTIDILADVRGSFIGLTVQTIAGVDAWAELIGAKRGKPFDATTAILHSAEIELAGWHVTVRAHIRPEPVGDLDDATRSELHAAVQS